MRMFTTMYFCPKIWTKLLKMVLLALTAVRYQSDFLNNSNLLLFGISTGYGATGRSLIYIIIISVCVSVCLFDEYILRDEWSQGKVLYMDRRRIYLGRSSLCFGNHPDNCPDTTVRKPFFGRKMALFSRIFDYLTYFPTRYHLEILIEGRR